MNTAPPRFAALPWIDGNWINGRLANGEWCDTLSNVHRMLEGSCPPSMRAKATFTETFLSSVDKKRDGTANITLHACPECLPEFRAALLHFAESGPSAALGWGKYGYYGLKEAAILYALRE